MRRLDKNGFTLVEAVVALGLFALMSVTAYEGLNAIIDTRASMETEAERWRDLAAFFNRVDADMKSVADRPVRDEFDNDELPSFSGKLAVMNDDDAKLSFTRMGDGLADGPAATPRRLGYRLRNGKVELVIWPALDRPPMSRPKTYPVLNNVKEFELRYLGESMEWYDEWNYPTIPRGVEVVVTLSEGLKARRLFALR